MPEILPTRFLPYLPRTASTFSPLAPTELLSHISVLRQLYLPPIHGGLSVSDAFYDDGDSDDEDGAGPSRRTRRPKRAALEQGGAGVGGAGAQPGPIPGSLQLRGTTGIFEEQEEEGYTQSEEEKDEEDQEEDDSRAHLDPFERDWAQKWLEGVFRRAQTWVEENDPGYEEDGVEQGEQVEAETGGLQMREVEAVLKAATAALAMMAGTSAAGSLTRHLLFPVHTDLAAALRASRSQITANPNLSPTTHTFLASLASPPTSPLQLRRLSLSSSPPVVTRRRASSNLSRSSGQAASSQRKRRPAIPVLLHDAPMGDHLSVGVQTWGSAILLGREMALRPQRFGLDVSAQPRRGGGGVRILELGAGTGLLSILCRKILDLQALTAAHGEPSTRQVSPGLVVATDFLPSVIDNLKICVDLNFPPSDTTSSTQSSYSGIHIAKLDWTTFPAHMAKRFSAGGTEKPAVEGAPASEADGSEETERFMDEPFDLVLASDCVYDPTHAEMLRHVAGWVLRLPIEDAEGDEGGTFHILSPLRPTFAPELESIDTHFPSLASYPPLSARVAAGGEGLGIARKLKLGVRGAGKVSVRGKKGEGRVDETLGYWWWEVGWG